jgi:CRP-like cAMP-binding protein
MSLDRLPSNELTMTEKLIANMLGLSVEKVMELADELQALGLLTHQGADQVLDRPVWRRSPANAMAS